MISRRGDTVTITSERLLATPLVIPRVTRKIIKTAFFRKLISKKKGFSIRSTYARISKKEFELLKGMINRLDSTSPQKFRRTSFEPIRAKSAKKAFEKWARGGGWELVSYGYPDLLASIPNGRIAAFEAKSGDDRVREKQERVHKILRSFGLRITLLSDVKNAEAEREIRRNQWSVVAKGSEVTRGWPDYLLVRGRKVIGCELKTGWKEHVSQMQVRTLSALSVFKNMEIHIVRVVKDRGGWVLCDDTERWLLYPP